MSFNKTIKRELEVAFSKRSQPVWVRILKYILLACVVYLFWESKWLWIILVTMVGLSVLVHLWYRYKTDGWTKSYGGWKHDKEKTNQKS